MELIRSRDEIKHGKIFKKLIAMVLRHATNASDNQPGLAGLDFLHEANLADGLPLRLITHGAGVEDNQIGILL